MTENIANNTEKKQTTKNNTQPVHPLLPNFCDVRNLFVAVLLTEVLAIVFSMAASTNSYQFWDYLALSSFLMLWIALLNSAALCLLRNWLHKQKQNLCLLLSFCLMMGVSLLVTMMVNKAGILFDYDDDTLANLLILRVMTISAVIYFLLLRYFYIQHQWRINLAAQSRAEIQALRARIRPHFLFNSMNTIASLIAISPETAERAIEDLSDLFRSSLSEQNMNRLGEEIELTKSYIAIESLRLGDRLQIEWQIDDNLLETEVPSLCLQPLAENAIYHGIEPIEKGGKIVISALQIGSSLKLSVSNPLMSDKQSLAFKKGNQMAQDNIRQRLNLVYGNKGKFTINDTKDSYTVSLLIPLDVIHERTNSR
jgi:two-component system sensor histidine kinase AlgZ